MLSVLKIRFKYSILEMLQNLYNAYVLTVYERTKFREKLIFFKLCVKKTSKMKKYVYMSPILASFL
jgi:hypothetical protein